MKLSLRAQAIKLLEFCDPGDCGCQKPHILPAEIRESLITEMMELIKND